MPTHVCQWLDGWKNVKASDVDANGSVAAKSGLFFCELCGQPVAFVKSNVYCSHFRHSSGESDKSCEDRATNFILNDWTLTQEEPAIAHPIRICVGKYEFHFERDGKYLSTEKLIGKLDGTLFSSTSGNQLPSDSDVRLGKKYYLLTKDDLGFDWANVEINYTGMHYRQCFLYEVKATALTEDAAKFFLSYRCRLTEKPIAIRILHPIYIIKDQIVLCNARRVFVFVEGNAPKFGVFPKARKRTSTDGRLIKIDCNERQQLLAAGRMQALRCIYFRCEMPTFESKTPTVEVTDVMNEPMVDGVYNVLPKERLLRLRAEFDGCVEINRDGFIDNRIGIKADEWLDVTGLDFGVEIKIYAGLDCVRTIRFERAASADEELYLKLERGRGRPIKISHAWSALADRLKDYPKVKGWLRKMIRAGVAPEEAYILFRRFVLNGLG